MTNTRKTQTERVQVEKKLNYLGQTEYATHTAGSVIIGTIFGMFMAHSAREFLEHTGKFFLFSAAALIDVFVAGENAFEVWYRKKIEKLTPEAQKKSIEGDLTRAIVKAVLSTVFAIPVVLAVVASLAGVFVGLSALAAKGPIIFTAVLGAKAVFNGCAALFYLGRSMGGDRKQKFREIAKGHAAGFLASVLTAPVLIPVMMLGKVGLAAMAVAGSLVGMGYAGYRIRQMRKQYKEIKQKEEQQPLIQDDELNPDGSNPNSNLHAHISFNRYFKRFTEGNNKSQQPTKRIVHKDLIEFDDVRKNPVPKQNDQILVDWVEIKEQKKRHNTTVFSRTLKNFFSTYKPLSTNHPERVIPEMDHNKSIKISA